MRRFFKWAGIAFKWVGIALGSLFLVGVIGFLIFWYNWSRGWVSSCTVADPVRVVVNSLEFHIPAILNPELGIVNNRPPHPFKSPFSSAVSKNGSPLQEWYCQEPDGPPFKATSFEFRGKDFSRASKLADHRAMIWADLENIDRFSVGKVVSSRSRFCNKPYQTRKFYFGNTLIYRNQFYLGKKRPKTMQRVLISKNRILFNTSFITWCVASGNNKWGLSCVFTQPVTSKNIVTGRFFDKLLPPENLKSAVLGIEKFIRSIAISSQQITPLNIKYEFGENGLICLPEGNK
ncbi:MAG: hypothetical protein GY943_19060 [Chloroflexi bacterium]|nr:hypothetical protein [Chloroflexota bacterium]